MPNTPDLNLTILPSYDAKQMLVGDISEYPSNWNIVSPTIEVTIPAFGIKTMPFTARSVMVLNAPVLGLDTNLSPLPDGLWTIKYSISPALTYNVTKTFLRVDRLYASFDEAFLKLDMMECDLQLKREQFKYLYHIEFYIQGAIAAGNKCANKLAIKLYNKAARMISNFVNNQCLDCNGINPPGLLG